MTARRPSALVCLLCSVLAVVASVRQHRACACSPLPSWKTDFSSPCMRPRWERCVQFCCLRYRRVCVPIRMASAASGWEALSIFICSPFLVFVLPEDMEWVHPLGMRSLRRWFKLKLALMDSHNASVRTPFSPDRPSCADSSRATNLAWRTRVCSFLSLPYQQPVLLQKQKAPLQAAQH